LRITAPTIQPTGNDADCGSIDVAPGTFNETVTGNGRSVTIQGRAPGPTSVQSGGIFRN
jgi:hypothetical protein